jgi:hypothetical protein
MGKSSASTRKVTGLKWAVLSSRSPWPKKQRFSRTQKLGLGYEKKLGRELGRRFGSVHSGQWIEFCDLNGRGFAQPDHYMLCDDSVIVFECKLTQQERGLIQLGQLYRPLLRKIYDRPVVGVLVCRVMRKECKRLIDDPSVLLGTTREDIFTWHWLD